MDENIIESLKAGKYELTPEGVFIPVANALARGVFSVSKRGEPTEFSENIVVDEGLDFILKAAIAESAGTASWYIALFTADLTPTNAWVSASFESGGIAIEWTDYDEAARPQWIKSALVASAGVDSFSNKASFTSSSMSQTVYGAGMLTGSAKNATSGTLLAASKFSSEKTLDTGEILDVGYGLQLSAV